MRRRTLGLLGLLAWWPVPAAGLSPPQEARAVLDRWLDAQNQGRFDDYQFYYEENFTGVRRSGNRTATFDRNGWTQDRKRMFEKPMTVAAENVHIFANERSARIVFTQRWSSGQYTDTGPKELVLRRRPGGGYGIVREELFASHKPGTVDLTAFRQFAYVVDGEVVVSTEADEAWATGQPIVEKRGADRFLVRSRRAVDVGKLPAALAKLSGMAVRLMDARGVKCEAKLGEVLLRGRIFYDMGADEAPDGTHDQSPVNGELVWNMSPHFLVARVSGDRKACAGATWARAADLATPPVATAEPPPPALKRAALAAFRSLPESQLIQREFEDWSAGADRKTRSTPSWFGRPRHAPIIRYFRLTSGQPLLSVSAVISEGDCAHGIYKSLWALWEIEDVDSAHPRFVLRNQPDADKTLQPTAAVDVNGDGAPELLFDSSSDYVSLNGAGQPEYLQHGIVRALDGSYVQIEGLETPIDICPC